MDLNELQKQLSQALGEGQNAQLFDQVKEQLGSGAGLGDIIGALQQKLGAAASGNSLIESLQNMLAAEDADGDGSNIDDILEKFGLSAEQADTAAGIFDKIKGMFGLGAADASQDLAENDETPEDDGSTVEMKFDDVE